jgi:hypothetical protein
MAGYHRDQSQQPCPNAARPDFFHRGNDLLGAIIELKRYENLFSHGPFLLSRNREDYQSKTLRRFMQYASSEAVQGR